MILNAAISALNTLAFEGYSISATDLLVDVACVIALIYGIVLICRLFRIIKESRKDD